MNTTMRRRLGAAGIAFCALFVLSGSLVTQKSAHDSGTQLAAFYRHHQGGLMVEADLVGLAVFIGLGFYWFLRELVAPAAESRQLVNLGFAGVLMFAAGGAVSAGINAALSDVATHASPQTLQTLNILQNDVTDAMGAGGVALFLVTTGIVVTRGGPLPRWLGWIAFPLALVALVIPEISGLAAAVWTLLVSVTLLVTRAPAYEPAAVPGQPVAVS